MHILHFFCPFFFNKIDPCYTMWFKKTFFTLYSRHYMVLRWRSLKRNKKKCGQKFLLEKNVVFYFPGEKSLLRNKYYWIFSGCIFIFREKACNKNEIKHPFGNILLLPLPKKKSIDRSFEDEQKNQRELVFVSNQRCFKSD